MSHKKAKAQKKNSNTSTLQEHKRIKKRLVPPLVELGVKLDNWSADMLPELFWPDSLLVTYEFNRAGGLFHKALDIVDEFVPSESNEIVTGLLSSFSLVPIDKRADVRLALQRNRLDEAVFSDPFKHGISLYEECPMHWLFEDWQNRAHVNLELGIRYMRGATERLLASRSKHATRCRMFSLARMANRGKLIFVKGAVDNVIDDLCSYSDSMPEEDQNRTEATVRAMFGAHLALAYRDARNWPPYFWRHNYGISLCEPITSAAETARRTSLVLKSSQELSASLIAFRKGYEQACLRAELDLYSPDRDDVLFGLVSRQFRLFSVLIENMKLWAPDFGLMFHRIMADGLIVLSYLIHENDSALFQRFKRYSLGKQKLYKMHLADYSERTGLDTSEMEEELAERINSEISEELLAIDLGAVFEGTDMHKMASLVGLDDLYRLVYSPTSAELHGEWVSLREHNLTTCANPLHRYHRLPKLDTAGVVWTGTVLRAAAILADTVQDWLGAYGLESEFNGVVETFRTQVADAFTELPNQQAASG